MSDIATSARSSRFGAILAACVATALLAGCANRDSVTVGSIPDDYRTNHPIIIADKEMKLDLPVSPSERGATRGQRASLEGFLAGYDRSAAPVLKIMRPSGTVNDVAAAEAASDFAALARRAGVPSNRVMVLAYEGSRDQTPPVRITYTSTQAQTEKCGRWPKDILDTTDNKHFHNFGCSMQNNVAAQVANPTDLMGPRKQTPIDAENRSRVIDDYRGYSRDADGWSPETRY